MAKVQEEPEEQDRGTLDYSISLVCFNLTLTIPQASPPPPPPITPTRPPVPPPNTRRMAMTTSQTL